MTELRENVIVELIINGLVWMVGVVVVVLRGVVVGGLDLRL